MSHRSEWKGVVDVDIDLLDSIRRMCQTHVESACTCHYDESSEFAYVNAKSIAEVACYQAREDTRREGRRTPSVSLSLTKNEVDESSLLFLTPHAHTHTHTHPRTHAPQSNCTLAISLIVFRDFIGDSNKHDDDIERSNVRLQLI